MGFSFDSRRREFLSWSAAALVAAHSVPLETAQRGPSMHSPDNANPRIRSLDLLTAAALSSMRAFYNGALGLRVLDARADAITFATGSTRLTFRPAAPEHGRPFYHFAFNIPENKIVRALRWQKARSALLPIPASLRDAAYPDDVVNYSHWNAHSIFFLDPGGNVVEYIARHDLKNGAAGDFGSNDILYASEIAFVVDDVAVGSSALKPAAGVQQYRAASEQFAALGDETGLLLVMRRGRLLNFDPSTTEKAAAVFPTMASIAGPQSVKFTLPGFPYAISVER